MNNADALNQAIALTDEILSVLDDRKFDKVSELERQREPLIRQAFTGSVEQIDRIKATHLQNRNELVVIKMNSLKQSVLQQQQQLRNGSKATRAYSANMG
jgi:hypothetical protein